MPTTNEHSRYMRLRMQNDRDGYVLRKSSRKTPIPDDQCGYMVLDASTNIPVVGFHWDADLDDVETWMRS